jgi:hypothetical protein
MMPGQGASPALAATPRPRWRCALLAALPQAAAPRRHASRPAPDQPACAAPARPPQPLRDLGEELAWLQRTFPPCVARHIVEAVRSAPHFTILVLQKLVPHKAGLVRGEQHFQVACRHLAAMYAMYLGRQTCLQGGPLPFFHGGGGSLPAPRITVEQFFTADGAARLPAPACISSLLRLP